MPAQNYTQVPILTTAQLTPVHESEVDTIFSRIQASWKDEEAVKIIRANYDSHSASRHPVVDGRPRVLHVTAWIVHEGVNNNRDVFVAEDLKAAVESGKLFQQPYGGVIDFNHNFVPIGYWYDAEYALDPSNGKYGILAHGVVWAWLYPEIADTMLLEQARNGKVDTSMVAWSANTQITIWSDNRYARIVREPVFTGASLLDRPPADPDANGFVAEEPTVETAQERRSRLLAAAYVPPKEEENMDELKVLINELDEKIAEKLVTALENKLAEARAQFVAHEERIAELQGQVDALAAEKAALQTSLDEKELALAAAKDEATALNEQVATLTAQVEEYTAAEAARKQAELAQARLAELPEAVRQRFDVLPENKRNELLTVWASLDEEAWALRKEELGLGFAPSRLPNLGLGGFGPSASGSNVDLKQFIRVNK